MYNIEIKYFNAISVKKKVFNEDKLEYIVNTFEDGNKKEVVIYNEYENLFLKDEVPKLYNQEYGEFKIDILVRIVESLNENFDAAVFPSVIAVLTNKGGVTIFRLGNLKADMQKGIVFEKMGDDNGGVLFFFGFPKGILF